ncbi:MAG: hypothetical protein KAQ63_01500 [Candidatus Moranbacteria bacterium]|nr:hypothetical protein [Candidatus Moranbacteria bacterium]
MEIFDFKSHKLNCECGTCTNHTRHVRLEKNEHEMVSNLSQTKAENLILDKKIGEVNCGYHDID